MGGLAEIVRTEVEKYAGSGRGYQLRLFAALDDLHQLYSVVSVDYPAYKMGAAIVVFARIAGDHVIIEEDTTNKPLLNALMQQGILREQIVLAYQGEPVPDPIETL
jgi:hypothetical protein